MPPLIARPRDPPAPLSANGEGSLRHRSLAVSAALHAGVLLALLLLIHSTPLPEEPVVTVTVLPEGPGAAGAAGGAQGGGGKAPEAQSTSAQAKEDDAPPAVPATDEALAEAQAEAASSPAPPQQAPPPQPSPTATAVALEAPSPPPRKPRPSHTHHSPPKSVAVPPAETPTDGPVQIAAAPAATPTPGPPGADSGPGGAGGVGVGTHGAGHGAIGDGPRDGPGDDYLDRLKRWINKFKHYPKDALARKQEGRVVVSFVILRDGTVLDPRIERSSGVRSLDEAAIEMLHAASPVPPLPEAYRGERASLDLPVGYSIGLLDKLF